MAQPNSFVKRNAKGTARVDDEIDWGLIGLRGRRLNDTCNCQQGRESEDKGSRSHGGTSGKNEFSSYRARCVTNVRKEEERRLSRWLIDVIHPPFI
jgi:hypothetical protein